jgi:hypothetical protein
MDPTGPAADPRIYAESLKKSAALSLTPLALDNQGRMSAHTARVLGPYRNGAKWRLVLLDGSARKSIVA